MKNLLALAILFPFLGKAQDTCQLISSHDMYTRETKLSTGFMAISSNGVQMDITVDATKSEIDFFIWVKNDGKCFDNESNAQISFEGDRYKANYKNTGSMNCKGAFHITFRNTPTTPPNLRRMLEKKLAGIKITGNGGEITEVNFTEEQKQLLKRKMTCLVTQSKALIKK